MMKKRLLAFGLAGVMLLGMSMNVFAETVSNTDGATTSLNQKLDVSYTVPVSYTVEIPSILTYNSNTENSNDLTFSQSELILNDKGKVTITSDKAEVDLLLKDNNEVKYKITLKKDDGVTNVNMNEIAVFTNSVKVPTTVKVKGSDTAAVAGEYTGSVMFTINYDEGKPAS